MIWQLEIEVDLIFSWSCFKSTLFVISYIHLRQSVLKRQNENDKSGIWIHLIDRQNQATAEVQYVWNYICVPVPLWSSAYILNSKFDLSNFYDYNSTWSKSSNIETELIWLRPHYLSLARVNRHPTDSRLEFTNTVFEILCQFDHHTSVLT